MYHVADHDHEDLTSYEERRAGKLVALTPVRKDALSLVTSATDDLRSRRRTAYDADTGRTIAGPGFLGRTNGKTAARREKAPATPAQRRERKAAERAFMRKAESDRRAIFISKRPSKKDTPPKEGKKKKGQ